MESVPILAGTDAQTLAQHMVLACVVSSPYMSRQASLYRGLEIGNIHPDR